MGNKAEFYLSMQMIADAIRALPEETKILSVDVYKLTGRRIHVCADSEEEVERIVAPNKPVYALDQTVGEICKRWRVDRYRGEDVTIHGILFVKKGEAENAEEG